MLKKIKKLILLLLISSTSIGIVSAQIRISGSIIEKETGMPLAGASIKVKESAEGNISDSEGRFSINAAEGQELIISYLGYQSKRLHIEADNRILNISLELNWGQLSEVVVTGALGIERQARELGTSAQSISNDNLNQGKTVNPIFGLTSKIAGLRINMYDAANGKVDPLLQIRLRGSRSLNTDKNNPIYVVDGVPIPEIGRINPNDIENITVLKGSNAAALYGSEGVNGAIMITTKQGNKGKGIVKFSNTTSFQDVFLAPPAQTQYGQGQNGVYSATDYESWGPAFDGTLKNVGLALPDGTQPQAIYSALDRDNRLDMFKTGTTIQNDLSFSGGDDKSTYFFSVQHVGIDGIVTDDESRRTGARFNGSRKFGKLNTSYSVNYIAFKRNTTPDGPWATTYKLPANLDISSWDNWQDPASAGNPAHFFTAQQKNPFFLIDNIRNTSDQQTINGKIELDYTFTSWFKILGRLGLYNTAEDTRASTGKFVGTGTRNVNGSVNDGTNNFKRLNGDLILNFNKAFGKFSTKLLLGQNIRTDDTKSIGISSSNLLLPGLFNPAVRTGELGGSATITQYRSLGTYGEFTAGYNNYLFLTLTGRNEQVSVLSKNNRSYFYPGVSTSFVFNEAIGSLKNSNTISYGKVFASYNRTGNVTLDPYRLNNAYSQTAGFPFGSLVGFTPGLNNPNPNIEPEFVTSYEAGLQLSFLNDRINFEGAYVFSDSEGQIFEALQSSATGYNNSIVNAGRLTNNIIELSLNGDIIRSKKLRWNLGMNFTHINNQVKELFSGLQSFRTFRQSYATIGLAYPALMVGDYARDPQGRVIVNAQGNTTTVADNTHLGTMVPPYQMGLSTMFEFKGISIGAQFDSRLGGWLYTEVVPAMYTAGTHPATVAYGREPFIFPNSVIKNTDGTYSPNTNVYSKGDKAFWDAQGKVQINTAAKSDFFKMRELNINYSIPRSVLSAQKYIKDASIGFVGTNLFIIRHKDNTLGDPESLYNSTDGYLSFRQIPPTRMFGFNVNLTF